jgi:hypothetical protein
MQSKRYNYSPIGTKFKFTLISLSVYATLPIIKFYRVTKEHTIMVITSKFVQLAQQIGETCVICSQIN